MGAGPFKNAVLVCGEFKMLNQSAGSTVSVVNAIQSPIMTSREIAELKDKELKNVTVNIRCRFDGLGEDALKFQRITAKGVQWIGGLWTAHKAAGGAE